MAVPAVIFTRDFRWRSLWWWSEL